MATAQSRVEDILDATINGSEYDKPPMSRVEEKLLELKAVIEAGGGGGTNDYNQLINKPLINDKTVEGSMTSDDLDVAPEPRVEGENLIFG